MKPFEKIPPDNLEENVLCRIKNLESALSSIKKSLAQSPEGTLCISKSNNSVQFYNRKKKPFRKFKKTLYFGKKYKAAGSTGTKKLQPSDKTITGKRTSSSAAAS